jgi:hypothetical protein
VSIRIHPKYIKPNDKVDLWDLGPVRVAAPEAPKEPVETKDLKGADFALAKIHYEDALEDYKLALRAYGAAKTEFTRWHGVNGGPRKTEMWSTDAVHALTIDKNRYALELPRGVKPGSAQIADDIAAEMSDQELQEAREKDPQFGKGSQR